MFKSGQISIWFIQTLTPLEFSLFELLLSFKDSWEMREQVEKHKTSSFEQIFVDKIPEEIQRRWQYIFWHISPTIFTNMALAATAFHHRRCSTNLHNKAA